MSTPAITVYGIKNCDTVQRALKRLNDAGIAYRFHDFKAEGLSRELAQRWIAALGVDTVVIARARPGASSTTPRATASPPPTPRPCSRASRRWSSAR